MVSDVSLHQPNCTLQPASSVGSGARKLRNYGDRDDVRRSGL